MNASRWFGFSALVAWVGLIGSLTVLVVAVRLDPDARGFGTHEQLGLAPCTSLALTGKPCLSCGMTTAFAALVHGEFVDSIAANPAGMVLCLLTALMPGWCAHALWFGLDPLRCLGWRSVRWTLAAVAALTVLVWVQRSFLADG